MELSGKFPEEAISAADVAEAQLVGRARQGDELAWERLVKAHQEPVFRLAYLVLGPKTYSPADAEDVTQEAFVRAYLKLHQFDESRPLRPWLLAIAANLARNRRRSAGRYWSALRRWWRDNQDETTVEPAHGQRAEAQLLWEAVQQLRPAAQQAVYLSYFLELSEAETAAVLDIPAGTVKSRLYRARKQLYAIIKKDFPALYADWQDRDERAN